MAILRSHGPRMPIVPASAFAGFRFPKVIVLALRWYLLYGLSSRDAELRPDATPRAATIAARTAKRE